MIDKSNPLSRLSLFPISTEIRREQLEIAGISLDELADQFGTPLYLYDRASMDQCVFQYRQALTKAYPADSGLTYAGKAFLCLGIAQWTLEQNLWLDCTGESEISIAKAAGVVPEKILVHGVSKSQEDIQTALTHSGTIVVDNLDELKIVSNLLTARQTAGKTDIWLRLRPGVAVETHAYTQTGQEASKFGLAPQEFLQAVKLCQEQGLPLKGLHFHQGSHFHDPGPLGPALDTALSLINQTNKMCGWLPETLCPGGGWGVPYHEDDLPHPTIQTYVDFIAERIVNGCNNFELPLPSLRIEPGRSLIAQAGVALYRLQAVKQTANRRWLLLDGGLADNPRPALYGARYSALPVKDPTRPYSGAAWIGGPFCESGDILIHDLPMADVKPGELIAIPVSGAYQLSMSSNYNGARKPAVVWLDNGKAKLLQRRENFEDLIRRDQPIL